MCVGQEKWIGLHSIRPTVSFLHHRGCTLAETNTQSYWWHSTVMGRRGDGNYRN